MAKREQCEIEQDILKLLSELTDSPSIGAVLIIQKDEGEGNKLPTFGVGGIGTLSSKHSQLGVLMLGVDSVRSLYKREE